MTMVVVCCGVYACVCVLLWALCAVTLCYFLMTAVCHCHLSLCTLHLYDISLCGYNYLYLFD